ncbi:endoribonuclease LACTB2 [Osmia lignaria lignaria]|uniref:endoribonuclease LACTB2 n=1 Tax=Osmia lignaria lignaria TaxID=1437193 RepID=UPI0014787095|nr:endoribonuclease LACTB2 [Osmia lignaria]
MKPLTNLPLISRLSRKVIRILGCNEGPMTLQGTNTYLVGTGPGRILIDAGGRKTAKEYTKLLKKVLEEERAVVVHLIVTHWHSDHLGGVNQVQDFLKTMNANGTASTVWKLPRSPEDKGTSKAEISTKWQALKDKQIMEVEGAKLCVEHTPGHSSDHACLLLEDEQILFSGDCILGERTAIFEDLYEYIASLKKILSMKPQTIYPGHGSIIKDPISAINYYIKHREKRESDILGILEENTRDNAMSEMDIVKQMYTDTSQILWEAAAYNVERHLDKLLKEGRVKGEKGKWQSI